MSIPRRPSRSGSSIAGRKARLVALLASNGGWVTAAELALQLGVSSRSVRGYIAELQRTATPVESGPLGYRWAGDSAPPATTQEPAGVSDDEPTDRQTAILRRLVSQAEPVDVFELAASLFVSDSTLESDLVRARRWLAERGVRIERSKSRLTIVGDEPQIRAVQAELIRAEATRAVDVTHVLQRHFPDRDFRGFTHAMKDLLAHRGLSVNDYGLANALIHIAVIVGRCVTPPESRDGGPADPPAEVGPVDTELASALGELIREQLGVVLDARSTAEIIDILGVRALTGARRLADVAPSDREVVDHICQTTAARFAAEYGHVLHADAFLERLRHHLLSLLTRARHGSFNRNPLTATMKASYPWVYELAVVLAEEFREATGFVIPEDEIAFLAFHLGASIRINAQDHEPVTICVYAPEYYDMAEDMAGRLASDRRFVVADVTSDLAEALASTADLLVTTTSVPGHRAVVVTPFINRDDLSRIARATEEVQDRRRARAVRIGLLSFFEAPLFVRVQTLSDPEAAIRLLGARMIDSGIFDDVEVERILERERLSSTALVDGLAIPHAIGMRARRTAFAVAVSEEPIRWADKWVSVVLMMAVAPGDAASLHVTMDALTALLLRPEALVTIRAQARDHATLVGALNSLLGEASDI